MSRVDELIAKLCPDGVRFATIGENAQVSAGATPSKAIAEYWTNGTIPWLTSGEVNKGTIYEADTLISQAGYDSCSTKLIPSGAVVMALAGQGKTRGMVARTRLACCTNQSLASIVPNEGLDSDFLYYYLKTQYARLRDVSSGDGTRGGLNLVMIRTYRIPVPPLEVQREIVRILDQFTQLEAELEAELEARRRQYEHYRSGLLSFDSVEQWAKLSDIADYVNGRAHEKLADPDGDVAMVTARFISRNGEANRFVRLDEVQTPAIAGDVAMVLSDLPNGRALARTFYIGKNDSYAINQRVARLRVRDSSRNSSRFLYHYLNRNTGLLRHDNGVDQTHLSKGQVTGLRFPVMPRVDQDRIAGILDKFDALVNDLSLGLPAELAARRKQYEYYRDKLLTFKELAA